MLNNRYEQLSEKLRLQIETVQPCNDLTKTDIPTFGTTIDNYIENKIFIDKPSIDSMLLRA